MTNPAKDARAELSAALAQRGGQPATTPDEASDQIAELRSALSRDLDTLRGRVPDTSEFSDQSKQIGAAAGIGGIVLGGGGLLMKRRKRRKAEESAVRSQAVALARELARVERESDGPATDPGGRSVGKIALLLTLLATVVAVAVTLRQRLAGDDDPWDRPA